MGISLKEVMRIVLHLIMFAASFYALSSLDLAKIMLPVKDRPRKALTLLVLMSLALGYLSAQFLLAITYQFE